MFQIPAFIHFLFGLVILVYIGELYCLPEFHFGDGIWSSAGRNESAVCFIVGDISLPSDVDASIQRLAREHTITCDTSRHTIGNVPDLSTSTLSFSEISFVDSTASPLRFAMSSFAIEKPSGTSSLRTFEQRLDLYLATEVGAKSEGSDSKDIVVVRRFLEFQVARIKKARGIFIEDPKQTAEYIIGDLSKIVRGDDLTILSDMISLISQGSSSPGHD